MDVSESLFSEETFFSLQTLKVALNPFEPHICIVDIYALEILQNCS